MILVGVSLSAYLLTGPLKDAAESVSVPAMEKSMQRESGGEHPSQVEVLYVAIFLAFTIYGAHLAARFLSDRTWRKADDYVREVRWSVLDFVAIALLFLALAGTYNTFFVHPSGRLGAADETTVLEVLVSIFFYVVVLLFGNWILRQRGCRFRYCIVMTMCPYGKLILVGAVGFLAFQPLHFMYRTAMVAIFHGFRLPIEGHPVVEELLEPGGMALKLSLALSVTLSAPFFEEIFFRGFLYQALRRAMDARAAVVISAGLFASIHPWGFQAILVFPLGLLLAYLMERTGSVVPCIAVHFFVNGSSLLLTLLVRG